jgi:hypothetical protein
VTLKLRDDPQPAAAASWGQQELRETVFVSSPWLMWRRTFQSMEMWLYVCVCVCVCVCIQALMCVCVWGDWYSQQRDVIHILLPRLYCYWQGICLECDKPDKSPH